MRKFSAVLMCLMLLGSLLAACGGKNNASDQANNGGANTPSNTGGNNTATTDEPKDDITQRKVTLKIHYPLPDETTLRAQEDDKIARFQEMYP